MINRYGLDTSYFELLIKRELSDLNNYTPAEFSRVCARMAVTADPSVLNESEFHSDERTQECLMVLTEMRYFNQNHKMMGLAWNAINALSPDIALMDTEAAYDRLHRDS